MAFNFERLNVWQKSRAFVQLIYQITSFFPESEKYGLIDQMRRAAVSVSSNIAEGAGRWSEKDKLRFFEIAYGSLTETTNQLILAKDLNFVNDEYYNYTIQLAEEIGKMLSGYRKAITG